MVDMTEEEKMMLRRLIVKEDELEELQMEIGMTINLMADSGMKQIRVKTLAEKMKRLSGEVEELKDKLREICGE